MSSPPAAAVLSLIAAIFALATALVGFKAAQLRWPSTRPTNRHDAQVFNRLSSLLPEGAFRSFLGRVASSRVANVDFAAGLEDWVDTASFANNTFLDRKLERRKQRLAAAIWQVLDFTQQFFSAAPGHPAAAVMKPDIAGIEGPTPWEYPKIARKLGKLAAALLREYDRFIQEGHSKLDN